MDRTVSIEVEMPDYEYFDNCLPGINNNLSKKNIEYIIECLKAHLQKEYVTIEAIKHRLKFFEEELKKHE